MNYFENSDSPQNDVFSYIDVSFIELFFSNSITNYHILGVKEFYLPHLLKY